MLSNAERQFLKDLEAGNIDNYTYIYRKTFKHRILKKHKLLTEDALLVSKLLDKLKDL
jgi:hypothetical protein